MWHLPQRWLTSSPEVAVHARDAFPGDRRRRQPPQGDRRRTTDRETTRFAASLLWGSCLPRASNHLRQVSQLVPISSGEAACQPTISRKVALSMPSTSSGESVDHYPPGKLSTDPVSSGKAVYRVPPTTSGKQASLSQSPPGSLSADPVSSGEAVRHVLSATPGEIVNQSPPGKLLTNKSRSPSPSSC